MKTCGAEALDLLGQMKQRDSLAAADNGKLKAALEAILATAEVHISCIHVNMNCVKVSSHLLCLT